MRFMEEVCDMKTKCVAHQLYKPLGYGYEFII